MVFIRLFRFHRRSGMSVRRAAARAFEAAFDINWRTPL